ncbi:MAG: C_GCAxxG_C_C family protein [Bacteroidia bacterium]|nr:MAG: C_GCAxxG_C_C family protein [Bacteroidia bacterium]
MEHSEQAKELFLSGYNCAQSVVLSFADDLKFSKELAQKMAVGFGGGMGKQQETCGAVTGAIMVLGLLKGEEVNNNDELKATSYAAVKDLIRNFVAEYKTTKCRDLIGCDLNTPEGSAKLKEEKIMENICADCVKKAVEIVEDLTA